MKFIMSKEKELSVDNLTQDFGWSADEALAFESNIRECVEAHCNDQIERARYTYNKVDIEIDWRDNKHGLRAFPLISFDFCKLVVGGDKSYTINNFTTQKEFEVDLATLGAMCSLSLLIHLWYGRDQADHKYADWLGGQVKAANNFLRLNDDTYNYAAIRGVMD